jgi:hypothetical protein
MQYGKGEMVSLPPYIYNLTELIIIPSSSVQGDSRIPVQAYAFGATVTGFTLVDPLLTEEDQVSLEEKAEALTQTIRLAFEPEVLPAPAILQEQAVPRLTQLLEQTCEYCEQQIRERTMR